MRIRTLVLFSFMQFAATSAYAVVGDDLAPQSIALIEKGGATSYFDLVVERVAKQVLEGTAYDGRLRVNLPPKAGYLNVYMFRRKALSGTPLAPAQCNCMAIPQQEAVVCDSDFVNSFINSINVPEYEAPESVPDTSPFLTSLYKSFLETWLLGHEIGHVVLKHRLDHQVEPNTAEEEAWGRSEEFDADTFVASKFAHQQQQQFGSFMTLSQLATSLYAKAAREQHLAEFNALIEKGLDPVFGTMLDIQVVWRRDRHPSWFIRTLDLFENLRTHYPNIVDSSGYWEALRSRVQRVELLAGQFSSPEWRCDDVIAGATPKSQDEHYVVGDAEYLDRLLGELPYSSLDKYMTWFEGGVTTSGYDANDLRLYISLIRADARFLDGMQAEALDGLKRAKAALGRLNPAPDFLTVTYARTASRVIADAKDRKEEIDSLFPEIERILQANHLQDDRQTLLMYVDLWEVLARTYGLQDPRSTRLREATFEQLAKSNYSLVVQDLLARWQQLAENQSGLPTDVRVDELMALGRVSEVLGNTAVAARNLRNALSLLDEDSLNTFPFRAYWNDRISRLMMSMRLGSESVYHAQVALWYRRQLLDESRYVNAEAVEHAKQQMAIQLNQLGFAHIINSDFARAIPALEASLALEETLESGVPLEKATALHNLAQAYVAVGDIRAETTAKAALELRLTENANPTAIEYSRQALAAAKFAGGDTLLAAGLLKAAQLKLDELNDFRQPADNLSMIISGKTIDLKTLMLGNSLSSPRMVKINQFYDVLFRRILNE